MSGSHRVYGIRVLKAVSSPLRLAILNLLFDRGSLLYSELMNSMKMNPSRDAGRFAYHLKFLLRADLLEVDAETKKYDLTDLGKMVIDVADRIERNAVRPKGRLIRTSRQTVEQFDVNKITDSLVNEGKMAPELAQKLAKEAEKQLFKSKTRFLTAPLVREVVNALLIEKGMEEYRHKLTRLGVPVHDISHLLDLDGESSETKNPPVESAGKKVFEEYTLLHIFPHDIADAHLSGTLHINDLADWILKPTEITHDLNFFLQNGLNNEKSIQRYTNYPPPSDLRSALTLIFNVILSAGKEVSQLQVLECFNIFLAPFIKQEDPLAVKREFSWFIISLSLHTRSSLVLELTVPDFLATKNTIASLAKHGSVYGDLESESQLAASSLIEALAEESIKRPMSNPRIIIRVRPETFSNSRASALLLKAESLVAERGIPIFLSFVGNQSSSCQQSQKLSEDWGLYNLRTGSLGIVSINLPRLANECEKNDAKLNESLRQCTAMAQRALEIKYQALKRRGPGTLPFLLQRANGDTYLRLDTCIQIVNVVGLNEAALTFGGDPLANQSRFLQIIRENLTSRTEASRRGHPQTIVRILPDVEASCRFAKLDIDRYGVAKVTFSGSRDTPFFSSSTRIPFRSPQTCDQQTSVGLALRENDVPSGLTIVELGTEKATSEDLFRFSKSWFEQGIQNLIAFSRKMTYCANCGENWLDLLTQCPSCGSVTTLFHFDPFAGC